MIWVETLKTIGAFMGAESGMKGAESVVASDQRLVHGHPAFCMSERRLPERCLLVRNAVFSIQFLFRPQAAQPFVFCKSLTFEISIALSAALHMS